MPAVWTPDAGTERLRRLVARRYQVVRHRIVRHRTRLKNEVHAILHAHLIPKCPHADLFNQRYPAVVPAWRRAWEHVVPMFAFPPAIRKMIYTTNALESLNRSLRKIIKTRGSFPATRPRQSCCSWRSAMPGSAGGALLTGSLPWGNLQSCSRIAFRPHLAEAGKRNAHDAAYTEIRTYPKRLLRQRGELLERPNAHLYETGGMRRVHLRGHSNILKRLLVHVCGFNLGLLMRQLTGVRTPRSLQGRAAALLGALIGLLCRCWGRMPPSWAPKRHVRPVPSCGSPSHITMNRRSVIDP